ncbi:MAG: 4-hydroxy-tetrahydrodipicolinate synthase [Actinomycetota bacterium]|jgi:4-hydroxy-tetrahydrodipicolinate synthase|nr:4-hydroxy-tetrahydrodipicolinate synthase [Actinomycetota bacterium]
MASRSSDDLARRSFGRVLTAMVTPFSAEGELDIDSAQRLATHLVDRGNDGLVISGTTGESPTTSDSEKERLLRAVVDAVGDRARVVAGVGTNDTSHTIELARAAEKAGAHGLLVVTPYYNKPPQTALVRHFEMAADATGLPVMLYDIPGRTGTPIEFDSLMRLAAHDRVVAVKDAKGDVFEGSRVIHETGLAYYSGDDALNLAWLTHGAVGVVSVVGHVAAREYADMVVAVEQGDLATALRLHRRLLAVVRAVMTRSSQGAITAKAALHALGIIGSRTVRPPLFEATEAEVDALQRVVEASGIGS